MANPNEINAKLRSADAEPSGPHGPEDKIYRLTRSPPEAKNAPGAENASTAACNMA